MFFDLRITGPSLEADTLEERRHLTLVRCFDGSS
jgi:hypothetical protein